MGAQKGEALSEEDMIRALQKKYEISIDKAKQYIQSGISWKDLEKSCLYGYLADRPAEEVMDLRKDHSWWQIEHLLGLTPETYRRRWIIYCADRLERWWGVDRTRAVAAMQMGYPMHYVKIAWLLSQRSQWTMEEILKDRTRAVKWRTWAKDQIGMGEAAYDAMIRENRNPSLPSKNKE